MSPSWEEIVRQPFCWVKPLLETTSALPAKTRVGARGSLGMEAQVDKSQGLKEAADAGMQESRRLAEREAPSFQASQKIERLALLPALVEFRPLNKQLSKPLWPAFSNPPPT